MPAPGGFENKLPVFSTPQQQITFYADDPLSFKQILTVYNPYEFLVKFRIWCSNCSKYAVSAFVGEIKPHHTVDIVIQHKFVTPSNIGIADKLRVHLYTPGQNRTNGIKDILLVLSSTAPKDKLPLPNLETDRFQQLETDSQDSGNIRQNPLALERNTNGLIFYFSIIVVCVIILLMPKVGDESDLHESIPRIPYDIKLWAAFILGMSLVLLIKT